MKGRKNWAKSEWESFQKFCINKEDFPYNNYESFMSWFSYGGGYYGGHTHQFKIITLNGEYVAIDYGIADMIKTLNDNGFYTRFCCSGHKDEEKEIRSYYGYIFFEPELDEDKRERICRLKEYDGKEGIHITFDPGDYIVRFIPQSSPKNEEEYYKSLSEIILKAVL